MMRAAAYLPRVMPDDARLWTKVGHSIRSCEAVVRYETRLYEAGGAVTSCYPAEAVSRRLHGAEVWVSAE